MLQETQTPVCVSGLASKKELLLRSWIVLFICFLYNNLSFLNDVCFLTDHQGLSYSDFLSKR